MRKLVKRIFTGFVIAVFFVPTTSSAQSGTEQALSCIEETITTKIRQGYTHRFIDMWMVIVDKRVFSRSVEGTSTGWYAKFLGDKNGEIQCGDETYQIHGIVPTDVQEFNPRISEAYLTKYSTIYPSIAKKMAGENLYKRTIELIIQE